MQLEPITSLANALWQTIQRHEKATRKRYEWVQVTYINAVALWLFTWRAVRSCHSSKLITRRTGEILWACGQCNSSIANTKCTQTWKLNIPNQFIKDQGQRSRSEYPCNLVIRPSPSSSMTVATWHHYHANFTSSEQYVETSSEHFAYYSRNPHSSCSSMNMIVSSLKVLA